MMAALYCWASKPFTATTSQWYANLRFLKRLKQRWRREKPSRVWGRDQLMDRVWGRDNYADTRTVDVHIGRLRKALKQFGGSDVVRTVRGAGYGLA